MGEAEGEALFADNSGKPLRVRLIEKGSQINWVPSGDKLTAASPGLKFASYSEKYFDQDVTVLEMVGDLAKLDDVSYIESQISDADTKSDGEMCKQMLSN